MSKKTLFTGLDPSNYALSDYIHMPLIKIVPRPIKHVEIAEMFKNISQFTHIIFTSKNAVRIFFQYFWEYKGKKSTIDNMLLISVGKRTSFEIEKNHFKPRFTAQLEQQEGIIHLLSHQDLSKANILLPRSSLARPNLIHFLVEKGVRHHVCNLYDTEYQKPSTQISLDEFNEVVFTSPSTVNAFFSYYKDVPKHMKFRCIGDITQKQLRTFINKN